LLVMVGFPDWGGTDGGHSRLRMAWPPNGSRTGQAYRMPPTCGLDEPFAPAVWRKGLCSDPAAAAGDTALPDPCALALRA